MALALLYYHFPLVNSHFGTGLKSSPQLGPAWRVAEHMHVSQLVPPDQKIVTIPHDGLVGEAILLMQANAFNQLPVEAQDGSIVGLFSYRSFTNNLSRYRPSGDSLSIEVGDMADDPYFTRPTELIGTVLDRLTVEGAIIIGNERDPYAIATSHDLLDYLWAITHPFMLIGDIETTLRDIMHASCARDRIPGVIGRSFPGDKRFSRSSLEDLTLGQLLRVLKNSDNFEDFFKSRFNDINYISQNLDSVLPIRNGLFHFSGTISDEDLERLQAAHGWLTRKWRATRVVSE